MPWCLANYLAAQSCRHFRQRQKLRTPRCDARRAVTWIMILQIPSGLVEDAAIDLRSSMAFVLGRRTLRMPPGCAPKKKRSEMFP